MAERRVRGSRRETEERFRQECERGDEEAVWDLLRQGVNINSTDLDGWNGLFLAVYQGHVGTVKLLLSQSQLDVNQMTSTVRGTVLHIAARYNRREIVEELLKRKDILLDVKDIDGETPKDRAVRRGNQDIVNMIEEEGLERTEVEEEPNNNMQF